MSSLINESSAFDRYEAREFNIYICFSGIDRTLLMGKLIYLKDLAQLRNFAVARGLIELRFIIWFSRKVQPGCESHARSLVLTHALSLKLREFVMENKNFHFSVCSRHTCIAFLKWRTGISADPPRTEVK